MTSISAQRAGCGANLRQRSIQPRFSEGAGCVQFPHRPGRSATRTEPRCSGGMPNILVVRCFEDNGSARAETISRRYRGFPPRNAKAQGERMAGVEPAWTVLQTAALPLGHTRIDPIMFVVNNNRHDCDQSELIAVCRALGIAVNCRARSARTPRPGIRNCP